MSFGSVYSCWFKKKKRCDIVSPKYRLQDSSTVHSTASFSRGRMAEEHVHAQERDMTATPDWAMQLMILPQTQIIGCDTKVNLISEGCTSRSRHNGCASLLHAPPGAPAAVANASKLVRIKYLQETTTCGRSTPAFECAEGI